MLAILNYKLILFLCLTDIRHHVHTPDFEGLCDCSVFNSTVPFLGCDLSDI